MAIGCARGYLSLGRIDDAMQELAECETEFGYTDSSIELTIEVLNTALRWDDLKLYSRRVLVKLGWLHSKAWLAQIRSNRMLQEFEEAEYVANFALERYPLEIGLIIEMALVLCEREKFEAAYEYMSLLAHVDEQAFEQCMHDIAFESYFHWFDKHRPKD